MRAFNPLPPNWQPMNDYRPAQRSLRPGFMRCSSVNVAKTGAWETNPLLKIDRPSEGKINWSARWLAPWPVCAPHQRAANAVLRRGTFTGASAEDEEVPYQLKPPKEKHYWADIVDGDVEKASLLARDINHRLISHFPLLAEDEEGVYHVAGKPEKKTQNRPALPVHAP